MKHYSYALFPVFFIVLGVAAIGLSVYLLIFSLDYTNLGEEYQSLIGDLGFILLGGILTTFRGRIKVEEDRRQIVKENRVFGLLLSKDRVKIPEKANHMLIQQKIKQGRGYIQGAVGFAYNLQSSDLYFTTDRGAVKIISTDNTRAVKIAEILKDQLKLDYSIKKISK